MAFIAGPFSCTWNSLACGQAEDGYTTSHQFFWELIRGDSFGESPQEAIYRGGEMDISFRAVDFSAAAMQTMFWIGSATIYTLGTPGRSAIGSSMAKTLVLTAVSGTTAATVPATLTLTNTMIKENFPVDLVYAPRLRYVPMRLRVLPSASGVFGTVT